LHPPLDHDVRVWLSAEEYLGALHAADSCDRTLSGYVRHLIHIGLSLKASAIHCLGARDEAGQKRDS
jgi:hypothetical protein